METSTFALLLFGALAGGFVSGLAGFGTALMALGIWLYVLPPSLAVPLVLICSVARRARRCRRYGRSWSFARLAVPGRRAGRRAGWYAAGRARRAERLQNDVGVLLLVFPAALYLSPEGMKVSFGGKIADAAVGLAGGISAALPACRPASDLVGVRGAEQGRAARRVPDLQLHRAVCRPVLQTATAFRRQYSGFPCLRCPARSSADGRRAPIKP